MEFIGSKWFYIFIVIILCAMFFLVRSISSFVIPVLKDSFMQAAVLKNGIAVNADIIVARQTTTWSGNKPVYRLTFRFKTREQKEVEASLLKDLTFEEIERFKPGNGTTIKYDPENPQRIALYDKPLFL